MKSVNEDTTKRLEKESCKKVEEALNTEDIKSESQYRIEEQKKLMDSFTI
jgi:hypothetical protein